MALPSLLTRQFLFHDSLKQALPLKNGLREAFSQALLARNLVPSSALKFSTPAFLVYPSPLLEEERHLGLHALIANLYHPGLFHRPGPGPDSVQGAPSPPTLSVTGYPSPTPILLDGSFDTSQQPRAQGRQLRQPRIQPVLILW